MSSIDPRYHERYLETLLADPIVQQIWTIYCGHVVPAGGDPNNPPPGIPKFQEYVFSVLGTISPELTRDMRLHWENATADDLETRVQERSDVAARVQRAWGKPLADLDRLLSIAEEFGLTVVHRLQAAKGDLPLSVSVVLGLHSRGVQVGEEILVLLRNGFAAGAEGRWRTLHELAVVAGFIREYGDEVAERYVLHDHIHEYSEIKKHNTFATQAGAEPYSPEETEAARLKVLELRRRFGKVFEYDYGWAAGALNCKPDSRGPTFSDLEATMNMSVVRPAYLSASQAIHAGTRGLTSNPGRGPAGTPHFLTRGTEYGIAEPGTNAAAALYILGKALMDLWPLPSNLIALKVFSDLVVELRDTFEAADAALGASDA